MSVDPTSVKSISGRRTGEQDSLGTIQIIGNLWLSTERIRTTVEKTLNSPPREPIAKGPKTSESGSGCVFSLTGLCLLQHSFANESDHSGRQASAGCRLG